jgi:hypothetical protein
MKTKIMVIALLAITGVTSQLFAQEIIAKSTGYDLKKNVRCRVMPTETGYSIAFEYDTKAPQDVTVDELSGKKGYDYYPMKTEYAVNSSNSAVTEIITPRDATSGLATGKRLHNPTNIKHEVEKSTPVMNESAGNVTHEDTWTAGRSGGGAGKATFKEFTITKRCGGQNIKYDLIDGECLIPTGDCPNGVCNLKIEWTDNTPPINTEIGSSGMDGVSRNSANFSLTIEDGGCTAMAINEKGLPGDKPRKTKSKN